MTNPTGLWKGLTHSSCLALPAVCLELSRLSSPAQRLCLPCRLAPAVRLAPNSWLLVLSHSRQLDFPSPLRAVVRTSRRRPDFRIAIPPDPISTHLQLTRPGSAADYRRRRHSSGCCCCCCCCCSPTAAAVGWCAPRRPNDTRQRATDTRHLTDGP